MVELYCEVAIGYDPTIALDTAKGAGRRGAKMAELLQQWSDRHAAALSF